MPSAPKWMPEKGGIMLQFLRQKASRWAVRVLVEALRTEEVQRRLLQIYNGQFPAARTSEPLPRNTWMVLWEHAARTTAEYIEAHMVECSFYPSREALFDAALEKVGLDGLYLEFGSGWEGRTIRYLASKLPSDVVIHGFDSFEGIPDAWFGGREAGAFATTGQLPSMPDNVRLHKGWFSDVLPGFLREHQGPVAFMHIDCDVYSSTKTIFDHLGERIVAGTVIQFDEYFNYPGWRQHEFRAFQEFVRQRGLQYEYLGYTPRYPVAVRVVGVG